MVKLLFMEEQGVFAKSDGSINEDNADWEWDVPLSYQKGKLSKSQTKTKEGFVPTKAASSKVVQSSCCYPYVQWPNKNAWFPTAGGETFRFLLHFYDIFSCLSLSRSKFKSKLRFNTTYYENLHHGCSNFSFDEQSQSSSWFSYGVVEANATSQVSWTFCG